MTGWQWHTLIAAAVCLAAAAAWLNRRFLHLAPTVALMGMALAASLVLLALDRWTGLEVRPLITAAMRVDFRGLLMDGILPFLLFAAALHVDLGAMKEQRAAIIVLSTAGVVVATLITGGLMFGAAGMFGVDLTLTQALLFGALIAPTDPIAVAGILRAARVSPRLEALVAGESLLNDGVGVVLFITLMEAAVGGDVPSLAHMAGDFAREAIGGVLLGLSVGWLACRMLAAVDDYPVEIFVTIAVAVGAYALGNGLGLSGPLAVVAAGLVISSLGRRYGMSEATQAHLDPFWRVADEILNAMLFMLVGLELLVVAHSVSNIGLAIAAIAAVLAARLLSVGGVLAALGGVRRVAPGALRVLTWGGVRGGISIALVLSLAEGPLRATLLTATYAVVTFSLLVQATTLGRIIPREARAEAAAG